MRLLHDRYGDRVGFVDVLRAHPGEHQDAYSSFDDHMADARASQQEEAITEFPGRPFIGAVLAPGTSATTVPIRGWGRRTGAYAARVPIHERFHVHRDRRGVLPTDHELRLYRPLVVRLHYRLEPV